MMCYIIQVNELLSRVLYNTLPTAEIRRSIWSIHLTLKGSIGPMIEGKNVRSKMYQILVWEIMQ